DDHDDHDDHHGHDHGEWDPHAWQNPLNAVIYVENILKALKAADPANADSYEKNAANYVAEIKKLNDEVKKAFAELSEQQRRFATNHEAFAYMAQAYDLKQIPVTGVGGSEPSAAQVARVLEVLKEEQVKAVFFENTTNNRLIEQVARDAKVKIGGTLVADALQKEGEGSTYLGMIKKNTDTLLEALK
ncbi:MAG: metal ABC transporter substrate-binding protein, partial [Alcaligenaceae bacterium]|nr:metal ABC transporter substrate-binding protein [Alcaligenaceae bacterium]